MKKKKEIEFMSRKVVNGERIEITEKEASELILRGIEKALEGQYEKTA